MGMEKLIKEAKEAFGTENVVAADDFMIVAVPNRYQSQTWHF